MVTQLQMATSICPTGSRSAHSCTLTPSAAHRRGLSILPGGQRAESNLGLLASMTSRCSVDQHLCREPEGAP
jgi:enhancing lycopene biosynthesis protein 2